MTDLKSKIFTLLKKCPVCARVDNCSAYVNYNDGSREYSVNLMTKQNYHSDDVPNFFIDLYIDDSNQHYWREIQLTEKEYMQLKWNIEEWATELELRTFEKFEDFCKLEPETLEDLLDD